MQPRFRLAKISDVKGIVTLCNEVFKEVTVVEKAEQIFRATAADEKQIHLVGELEGEIIAYAKVTIVPTLSEDLGTFAILNHVCVKPELRRGGIGTKLLNACFAVAKHYNCKSMKLWSKNFRRPAHRLYRKYGFKIVAAKFFEKEIK